MTIEQAKEILKASKEKDMRSAKDIAELVEAIRLLGGSWAKNQNQQ